MAPALTVSRLYLVIKAKYSTQTDDRIMLSTWGGERLKAFRKVIVSLIINVPDAEKMPSYIRIYYKVALFFM